MSFGNARVLAFESRRAPEIAELIRINGGDPFVAPTVCEVPLEENTAALEFADRLDKGGFEMVIFLTGVGARQLERIIATHRSAEHFIEALRQLAVVVRGPKPAGVMREWGVPIAVNVPEPNTWREVLIAVEPRPERSVAVQEYGRSNPALIEGLQRQGRQVTPVTVYQWRLPGDTRPLRSALDGLLSGRFEAVLFTTGVQIEHLLLFADELGLRSKALEALQRMFIGSIGPTCSEALRECGLQPSMEPTHPRMGILVREAAQHLNEPQRS
jgi:uroporphyrinogen-III synthase